MSTRSPAIDASWTHKYILVISRGVCRASPGSSEGGEGRGGGGGRGKEEDVEKEEEEGEKEEEKDVEEEEDR